MTNDERLAILTVWQLELQKARALIAPVDAALGLACESPIHTAVWGLQDAYTAAVAQLIGDTEEWLAWFSTENDFGAKGLEASGPGGKLAPIQNLSHLLRVMEPFK